MAKQSSGAPSLEQVTQSGWAQGRKAGYTPPTRGVGANLNAVGMRSNINRGDSTMSAETQQTGVRPEELTCPACGHQGGRSGKGRWRCTQCDTVYSLDVLYDQCGEPVERVIACGGFEDYFCNQCKAAKSKRKVIYQLTSMGANAISPGFPSGE